MIIVVLIVALLSIIAVSLLDLVRVDFTIGGQDRRTVLARDVADGVAVELMDSNRVLNNLPDYGVAGLQLLVTDNLNLLGSGGAGYNPSLGASDTSVYPTPGTLDRPPTDYSADVRLLRHKVKQDSSLTWTRDTVYEMRAVGVVNNGDSTAEVRTLAAHTVVVPPGTILPQLHAR